jgi:Signal transduction histidine kinase
LWFISLILLLFIAISAIILFVIIKKKESKLKWEMSEYEQNINKEKINFLINVSHELRTPLTLIYAPLKRLINNRNSYDTQTISKQLNNIYKQARQMKNIINMVLDINRFNQEQSIIKFSTQDFNSWVKVVTDDFTNELQDNNLHLTLNLDNNIGKLSFDEWKCQIVLSNLLINAIKFSPNGAWIKVTTSIIGNKIRTSVSDEGIGLKDVDISNLFSRFYQGDHNIIGSGIGLSYAKQLITAHGGEIGAFNNKLKGATFFFDLPLKIENTSVEQNNISNIEITPQINYAQDNNLTSLDYTQYPSDYFSYYTIVIADDEDDFRMFLNDSLKGYFKQVYTATNGKEAIELCKKFNPDIVISDVMMPNMNGFELCKTMKSSLEISHIPIILLTAMGDKDNTIFGYKQGADFYIPKPFDIDFLLTIINKLIKNKENIHSQLKNIQIIPKPEDITISNSDEIFLRKVNDIINENIGNNKLSINFITDAVSMSRTSLYNKMKALTGMGVNDYINIIRIEKATELLKNSDLNINEISDSLGFSYPRYFSTTFKQIMGRTPSEYKKEHINGEV